MTQKVLKHQTAKEYLSNLRRSYHWLDIAALGIFFIILGVAFFFFLRRAEYITITLKISESDTLNLWAEPPDWYVQHITPGMEDKDLLGRKILQITGVEQYRRLGTNQNVFVTMDLRAVYNKTTNQYSFNGSPLLLGSYHVFKFQNMYLPGVIHEIGDSKEITDTKILEVEGFLDPVLNDNTKFSAETTIEGIPRFLAQNFINGLTIKDSNGVSVAKIMNVRRSPASRTFIYNSQLIKAPDPERERVEMTLLIVVEKINNKYYFRRDTVVAVNAVLALDFDTFGAQFTVTVVHESAATID